MDDLNYIIEKAKERIAKAEQNDVDHVIIDLLRIIRDAVYSKDQLSPTHSQGPTMDKEEFQILVRQAIKRAIHLYGSPVRPGAVADYLYKRLFENIDRGRKESDD